MKIRPLRAKLFHADGRMDGRIDRQTDLTKLVVFFRNFENEIKSRHPMLK